MPTVVYIGMGGAIGTVARYWMSYVFAEENVVTMFPLNLTNDVFPWTTLLINVFGSFAIGLYAALPSHAIGPDTRLFVMTGLCGGFTTFSTFSLQTLIMLQEGEVMLALLNMGLSVLLCLVAVAVGHMVGSWF